MKRLRLIILLLSVLALVAGTAFFTCPASVAYRWYAQDLGPVALADLSGSVWHGHAGSTRVFGREVGALDWELAPWSWLNGELLAKLHLRGEQTAADGTIAQGKDLRVDIRDAAVRMPAALLDPALGIPSLSLRGRLDVQITHLRLLGLFVEAADGKAFWRDAAVAGAAQAQLGDLAATFTSRPGGGVSGEVHDLGGALSALGAFTLSLTGYDATLKLAARDGNAQVREALQYVGEPQPDGSALLVVRGRLLKMF